MSLEDQLLGRGYVLLKGAIPEAEVERARGCIRGDAVEYGCMQRFVEAAMLAAANDAMNSGPLPHRWKWDARYVKYRVSDNNNSSDASTFHRDVICLEGWQPVFTCLSYLDFTVMELIPGSHRQLRASVAEAAAMYPDFRLVAVEPGDVLLFSSTLLHRGIFTDAVEHRRLVQIFDVYPNREVYKKVAPRTLHVPGDETYSDAMIAASKNKVLVSALNLFGYLNAATGYGQLRDDGGFITSCMPPGKSIVSIEGLQGRLDEVVPGAWQPINKYVHALRSTQDSLDDACTRDFKFRFYNRQFIAYVLFGIAVLVGIVWLMFVVRSHYFS